MRVAGVCWLGILDVEVTAKLAAPLSFHRFRDEGLQGEQ